MWFLIYAIRATMHTKTHKTGFRAVHCIFTDRAEFWLLLAIIMLTFIGHYYTKCYGKMFKIIYTYDSRGSPHG